MTPSCIYSTIEWALSHIDRQSLTERALIKQLHFYSGNFTENLYFFTQHFRIPFYGKSTIGTIFDSIVWSPEEKTLSCSMMTYFANFINYG